MRTPGPLVGLIDQGMSSASNLMATIAIASLSTAQDFGTFGLTMTIYLLSMTLTKGVAGGVAALKISHLRGEDFRSQASEAVSASAAVGLVCAITTIGTSGVIASVGVDPGPLLALSAFLPVMAMQDTMRHLAYAAGSPAAAAWNSAGWLAAQALGFGALAMTAHAGTLSLVTVWAGTASVGMAIGLSTLHLHPSPRLVRQWLRTHRPVIKSLSSEYLLVSGVAQGAPLVLAATAGMVALGSFRGAITLLGPLTTANHGIMMAITPVCARRWRNDDKRYNRPLISAGLVLGVSCGIAGLVLTHLPGRWGTSILGASWEGSADILILIGIWLGLGYLTEPSLVILRITGRNRLPMLLRAVVAPSTLMLCWVGSETDGARGAAAGLALAALIGLFVFWTAALSTNPNGPR